MREFNKDGAGEAGAVDGRFIIFARGVQRGRFIFKGSKGESKGSAPY